MGAASKRFGVESEMVGPDVYDAQAEQQEFLRVLAKKPAGILVSAADATLLQGPIDQAISQDVPVITIDSDSPKSKRLLFIGTNNYQAGRMGGEIAARQLGGKGNVVVFTIPAQENLEERLKGYKDVFADHPGIKIIQTVNDKGDARVAFDTTSEIIASGKTKPDGFVCLDATACKEVADVLDRKKVTGKTIVAMDTDKETLEWVKKGVIAATIAQKPYTMAYFGTKILDDLHHYKLDKLDGNWAQDTRAPLPGFVDTGATLIDKSNIDAFLGQRDAADAAK